MKKPAKTWRYPPSDIAAERSVKAKALMRENNRLTALLSNACLEIEKAHRRNMEGVMVADVRGLANWWADHQRLPDTDKGGGA